MGLWLRIKILILIYNMYMYMYIHVHFSCAFACMCTKFNLLLSSLSIPSFKRDEADFIAFCHWIEDLYHEGEQPFLQEVVRLDVRPCLEFENTEVRLIVYCCSCCIF